MLYAGPEMEGYEVPCSPAGESKLALECAPGAHMAHALHVWRMCLLLLQTQRVIITFMNFQFKVLKKMKSIIHLSASECCCNILMSVTTCCMS